MANEKIFQAHAIQSAMAAPDQTNVTAKNASRMHSEMRREYANAILHTPLFLIAPSIAVVAIRIVKSARVPPILNVQSATMGLLRKI